MTGSSPTYALLATERLFPHEDVDEKAVKRLAAQIQEDEAIHQPVLVDRATNVILDGHHRFTALNGLGCRFVPCYRVDYLEPTIIVERWGSREALDKHELLQQALAGERYPVKTSRHRTLFELPARETALSKLREEQP